MLKFNHILTGILSQSQLNFPPLSKTSLVSCWEMDETSGLVMNDSNSKADGTISLTVTINDTGILDKSYLFNNDTALVTLPMNPYNFNAVTESYTFNFWVKSSDPSPTTSAPYIITPWNGILGNPYPCSVITIPGSSDETWFMVYNGSSSVYCVVAGSKIWDDNWNMLTVVVTHTDKSIKTYVNTTLEDTKYYTWLTWASNSNTIFNIGKHPTAGRPYRGNLDQLSIWEKALSTSDISALYNNGNGNPYSNWT